MPRLPAHSRPITRAIVLAALLGANAATAQITQMAQTTQTAPSESAGRSTRPLASSAVSAGVKRLADVPCGPDQHQHQHQHIDVYLPVQATDAPALARESGTKPWLGTVALDSAALDLERRQGHAGQRAAARPDTEQVNSALGLPGAYTEAVDSFMSSLLPLRK